MGAAGAATPSPSVSAEVETAEAGIYAPFVRRDAFGRCGLTVRWRQKARRNPILLTPGHASLDGPCVRPTPPPPLLSNIFALSLVEVS